MSGRRRWWQESAALRWSAFIWFAIMMFAGTTASAGGVGLGDSEVRYDSGTGDLAVCGHLSNYAYSSKATNIEVALFEIEFGPSKLRYFWNPPRSNGASTCVHFRIAPGIADAIYVGLYPLAEFTSIRLPAGEDMAVVSDDAPREYRSLIPVISRGSGGRAFEVGSYHADKDAAYLSAVKTYLQINHKTPGVTNVTPGASDTPLIFSWTSRDVPPGAIIEYRYRLYPTQIDWSNWSDVTQAEITFIPAGIHAFEVEARASKHHQQVSLPKAQYQFVLESNYVGPATTKGGPSVKTRTGQAEAYTRQRALLIGVPTYDSYFQPLSFVNLDISQFRDSLIKLGFRSSDIVIGDSNTTSSHIMSELRQFLNASRDGEQTIIYLSGHGFADKNSDEDHSYFAGSNCNATDTTTCVDLTAVKMMMAETLNRNANAPRHILLVVDACAAGRTIVAKGFTYEVAAAQGRAVHVITAGTRDEEAREDPTKHMSLFTRYLVEGLGGSADIVQDGVITLSELMVWVRWQVAKASGGAQTPSFARVKGTGEMMFDLGGRR